MSVDTASLDRRAGIRRARPHRAWLLREKTGGELNRYSVDTEAEPRSLGRGFVKIPTLAPRGVPVVSVGRRVGHEGRMMARTHVVIASELLAEIDRVAGERGRGRFLEDAAREKLDRIELEKSLRATSGIARGPRYRHWKTREAAAEWVGRMRLIGTPVARAGR